MISSEECADLLSKKNSWVPIEATKGPVVKGAEQCIGRATALRNLEIPVGDFIDNATKGDLPVNDIGLELLRSNIEDEKRHDIALENLYQSLELTTGEDTETAKQFLEACLDLEDHPISIARVLEASVFFVILPMYRYLGSFAARTISADISRDERIHVHINTLICNDLKLEPSKQLKSLRREIVAWITEDLNCADSLEDKHKQYGEQQFWLTSSDNLLNNGKAPELNNTKRTRMLPFFEVNNMNLPNYVAVRG